MSSNLKSLITSTFKLHGLNLRSDAVKYIVDVVGRLEANDQNQSVERLLEAVQKQNLMSTLISRSVCEDAVKDCNIEAKDFTDMIFNVINAYDMPRFEFDSCRKKYQLVDKSRISIHGDADEKTQMFLQRYFTLQQRTLRHSLFSSVAIAGSFATSSQFQLRSVDHLIGSSVRIDNAVVMGLLTQLKEGQWFLEDPSGAVHLDLSEAVFHSGLFTDNCFVLAEGWFEDHVFHITALGFPPAENSSISRSYLGNTNFFGGPSPISVKSCPKLLELEQHQEDSMIIFVSDVWLDDLQVLDKVRFLLSGYAELPPTAFVFMGNFLSQSYGWKSPKKLEECFNTLASLLLEFPSLCQHSRFVLVAGPQDFSMTPCLPKPPFPEHLVSTFTERIPSATFASNPCRLQFCTQEIVVFRDDLLMKLCRNCVKYPSEGELPAHFAKTLICQATLSPLPLRVSPVQWPYSHTLGLFPLPDIIVTAVRYDPFTVSQNECIVTNPGSFRSSGWSFKVYLPATKQVEDSRLPAQQ